MINAELIGENAEGSGRDLISGNYHPGICLEALRKPMNASVRIADLQAKI
jgi:hypothetical protein